MVDSSSCDGWDGGWTAALHPESHEGTILCSINQPNEAAPRNSRICAQQHDFPGGVWCPAVDVMHPSASEPFAHPLF